LARVVRRLQESICAQKISPASVKRWLRRDLLGRQSGHTRPNWPAGRIEAKAIRSHARAREAIIQSVD
jgi:hypothetical protein